jgi:molybdopterin-guanine dinucleotide biosynthesis protein MobB
VASGPRLISVVGKKNSGKTTTVVAISRELAKAGHCVGTIKHGTHSADIDREGTDTWRHFHEGRAERVMIEGPGGRAYFQRAADEADPLGLARHYMQDTDFVLLEGFTKHPIPKIEVFRHTLHQAPHYRPDHPMARHWVAMVSDTPMEDVPFPLFLFSDTDWLISLKRIAWDAAMALDP